MVVEDLHMANSYGADWKTIRRFSVHVLDPCWISEGHGLPQNPPETAGKLFIWVPPVGGFHDIIRHPFFALPAPQRVASPTPVAGALRHGRGCGVHPARSVGSHRIARAGRGSNGSVGLVTPLDQRVQLHRAENLAAMAEQGSNLCSDCREAKPGVVGFNGDL